MTEQTTTPSAAFGLGGPKLFKALAEFQATKPRAVKDKKSNFAKYASYESVLDAAAKAHDFGLSVSHTMDGDMMVTILAHVSGEILTSRMRVLADRQNAHGYGSGMSFTKRYAISAMLCIPAVDDDDGNGAMVSTGHEGQTKKGWRKKEADAKRRASHSDDFKAGKMKGMFPTLEAANIDYNMVNTWRISKGQPKLSEMPKNEANRLIGALLNKGHAARQDFDAWSIEHGNV